MADNNIPDGFVLNALGHLVPVDKVREQDQLRDDVARSIADRAVALNTLLKVFKDKALKDIDDLVAIAADKYGARIGGRKGNVSITTYDGEFKVLRAVADRVTFTEEIEAAKGLINDCILRWSVGANDNIRVLVDRAFRTDKQGQLKTAAVLELLRLDIDDEEWKRAMEALKDSIQTSGTAIYIRVYRRVEGTDRYEPIPLDLAVV